MIKAKNRTELLARQAATQQRYAERLKARKAPHKEDIARALLSVVMASVAYPIPPTEIAILKRLVFATHSELVARGFSPREADIRVRRILWPKGPISR